MNYAQIAFTEAVQALQTQHGSRSAYARMEAHGEADGLGEQEWQFIAERDHFYMASVGENGFPYIQHRGGPAGFLKVLDDRTLGFADYRGNKQYISVGNLASQPKVALILMDYAARARLKLFAEAEVVELSQRPDLLAQLAEPVYKAQPERMVLLHVQAFDWNCPQHITPRYTEAEIESAFAGQRKILAQQAQEIQELRAKLQAYEGA